VRAATEMGKPFEVEYRIITRKGVEKWVWERGRVVEIRADGVAILEGFITDITDRKLAETALKRAQAYAQAVVESAVEAVITIDREGIIESFNKAAQTMFGIASNDILGTPCRHLFATSYYREFDQHFKQCKDQVTRTSVGGELNGSKIGAEDFPLHLSISEVLDDQERKFVLLIRDLTSQRSAEKEVREQRDLLAHVDRLNTLGEMAAGIAHEINQPLTAISLYAQSSLRFLQAREPRLDRLQDALTRLSQQAHRAGAVIERMQEMTRPGESHQRPVDCESLIREVHSLAEVEAHIRNFIIVLRLDNNLPEVLCDPIQVQQVILNLLRNGMESMKTNHCDPNSMIILQAEKQDESVRISIIDTGIGISGQLQKQLYQPFISNKQSGMGLGLSISRSIIVAHGGKLEFSNNKNNGATFYFNLVEAK